MEAGPVLRAAEMMHLSQPAVSRLLSDLELRVGCPPFDRRKGRLTPRTEARQLYAEVDRAFVGLGESAEAAGRIRIQQTTRLRVAALPFLTSDTFAHVVAQFLDENPDLLLSLLAGSRIEIIEGILKGHDDLGLTSAPLNVPEIASEPLAMEEYLCLVPSGHALSRRNMIRRQDLEGVDFIAAADRTPAWHRLERTFTKYGVRRSVGMEA